MSNEKIISTKITDTDLSPRSICDNPGVHLNFSAGDFLKQDKVVYNHGSIIDIYVVYKINLSSGVDITLDKCLFGAVTLTKNSAGADKYKYSGYEAAFISQNYLHEDSGKNAKDLIIFGADLSNSSHSENKKNNILVLGENSVKLNNMTIQAESALKTNSTVINQKFVLSLHYNSDDSYL